MELEQIFLRGISAFPSGEISGLNFFSTYVCDSIPSGFSYYSSRSRD